MDIAWPLMVTDPATADEEFAAKMALVKTEHLCTGRGDQAIPTDWCVIFSIAQWLVLNRVKGGKGRNVLADALELASVPGLGRSSKLTGGELSSLATFGANKIHDPNVPAANSKEKVKPETIARWLVDQVTGTAIRGCVLDCVNQHRSGLGLVPLVYDDLFQPSRFRGPEAIAQLWAVLARDKVGKDGDDATRLEAHANRREFYIERAESAQDPRGSFLDKFADIVFAPQRRTPADTPPKQVFNAYGPNISGGLTALARELFDEKHRAGKGSCNMPLLYVPLHGRSAGDPADSFPEIVGQIARFYACRQTDQPPEPANPNSLDDLLMTIDQIRTWMEKKPAIIVFDGYRRHRQSKRGQDGVSMANLLAAIEDDWLFDLIDALLTMRTPKLSDSKSLLTIKPVDAANFLNNRFVIISEQPLFGVDGIPSPLVFDHLAHTSVLIPAPQPQFILDKALAIGLPPAEIVAAVFKHLGAGLDDPGQLPNGIKDPSSPEHADKVNAYVQQASAELDADQLTEGLIGTISACVALGHHIPKTIWREKSRAPGKLLRSDLLPKLQEAHPDWYEMLALIATAPGGLRPKTLLNTFIHLQQLQGREAQEHSTVTASIRDMVVALSGIIGLTRADGLETFTTTKNRPDRLRNGVLAGDNVAMDRTIQFTFDDIRETILASIEMQHQGASLRSKLHLVLAENAFEQYTLVARHDDRLLEGSLRRQRRLLACLYHGISSIPGNDFNVEDTLAGVEGQLEGFIPFNLAERWEKLYGFVYGECLNLYPSDALSRIYAADLVRQQLLEGFASPTAMRGGPRAEVPTAPAAVSPALARRFNKDAEMVAEALGQDWRADSEDADRARHLQQQCLSWLDTSPTDLTSEGSEEFKALCRLARVTDHLDDHSGPVPDDLWAESLVRDLTDQLRSPPVAQFGLPRLTSTTANNPAGKLCAAAAKDPGVSQAINAYGELMGIRADLLAVNATADVQDINAPIDRFLRSFAAYRLAADLRKHQFRMAPDSTGWLDSRDSTKGFVRVALKLEGLVRKAQADRNLANTLPDPGWFLRQAGAIADEFAVHYSRYPRDRAGMLVLEAMISRYRVDGEGSADQRRLMMALECLSDAEMLVLRMSGVSRLRQRFHLERLKVLRDCAFMLHEWKGMQQVADALIVQARTDLACLKAVNGKISVANGLWSRLADRIVERGFQPPSNNDGSPR